jgi:hypothetical protein
LKLEPLSKNGWRPELEAAALARLAAPTYLPPVKAARRRTIDYSPFIETENQGPVGSCQGHAISTLVELLVWLKYGRKVQLSRMFAYIGTQKLDGIRGDRGSSIGGGVELATKTGIPLERYWPYPGRYVSTIPAEATAHAGEFLALEVFHLKTGQAVRDFLAEGECGVTLGMQWRRSLSSGAPVVEDYGGGGGGGHALLMAGVSKLTDTKTGERYTPQYNSHGTRHGTWGRQDLSPRCVDQILEDNQFGAYGLRGVKVLPAVANKLRKAA